MFHIILICKSGLRIMGPQFFSLLNDPFLSKIINKPVHIKSASNEKYILSQDFPSKNIIMSIKDLEFPKASILLNNENSISIELNGMAICIENSVFSQCDQRSKFNFIDSLYGYKILRHGKCLTIKNDGKLIMEECSDKNILQYFILDDQSKNYCLDSSNIPQKKSVNLSDINKKGIKNQRKKEIAHKALNKEFPKFGIHKIKMKATLEKLVALKPKGPLNMGKYDFNGYNYGGMCNI